MILHSFRFTTEYCLSNQVKSSTLHSLMHHTHKSTPKGNLTFQRQPSIQAHLLQQDRRRKKEREDEVGVVGVGKTCSKLLPGWFTFDGRRGGQVSAHRISVLRAFEQSPQICGCREVSSLRFRQVSQRQPNRSSGAAAEASSYLCSWCSPCI